MTDWPVKTLDALCEEGVVLLGRGNIISKKDIAANPGPFPIYSSARENDGKFGEYGDFMFDEEMITWSIDGGGRLFYRPKHKFSVTNVGGTLRVLNPKVLEIRYLHRALENLHSRKVFDWVFKAHPSVIRKVYDEIPVPPLEEQKRIVALLDAATARVVELTACYEQARTHANNLFASALRDSLESDQSAPLRTLDELCEEGTVKLGRGNIISKKDIAAKPGSYPIYSSARENEGKFGEYGDYMFDEEMITWSIDGGGRLFYRPKHKFSVTNVGGTLRVLDPRLLDIQYLHRVLQNLHSQRVFDWVFKAHPSVIRKDYDAIPMPPLAEQKQVVARLDSMRAKTSEMVAAYDAKLTAAKNLRQSILEAAFAGEL